MLSSLIVISPFFYFQVYRSKPSRVNPYFIYYMDVIGLYYRHQNPQPARTEGFATRTAPQRCGAVTRCGLRCGLTTLARRLENGEEYEVSQSTRGEEGTG